MTYSRDEKRAEIEREIVTRKRTYPRLIEGGRLDAREAHARLSIMRAIAKDYADNSPGGAVLRAVQDLERSVRHGVDGEDGVNIRALAERVQALTDALRAELTGG